VIRMPNQAPPRRWNRADLESRIKHTFWSLSLRSDTSPDETWLSYSELKRSVQQGGPPLSDKTFSLALKRLLSADFLKKESRVPRSRYRLNVPLREEDFKSALLASDVQRLEMAAQVGCRGNLRKGYAIYAIDSLAPRDFIRDLEETAESSRLAVLESAYKASDELIHNVERTLVRARMDRRRRMLIRAFLERATEFRMEMGNIPAIAAYGKGVEQLLGAEFGIALMAEAPRLAVETVKRTWANPERHLKRFFKPITMLTESSDPLMKGIAHMFYDFTRLTADGLVHFKSALKEAGIRYSELRKLSERWFALMKSLRPTLVVSA
jgi:hypothetical protein